MGEKRVISSAFIAGERPRELSMRGTAPSAPYGGENPYLVLRITSIPTTPYVTHSTALPGPRLALWEPDPFRAGHLRS